MMMKKPPVMISPPAGCRGNVRTPPIWIGGEIIAIVITNASPSTIHDSPFDGCPAGGEIITGGFFIIMPASEVILTENTDAS